MCISASSAETVAALIHFVEHGCGLLVALIKRGRARLISRSENIVMAARVGVPSLLVMTRVDMTRGSSMSRAPVMATAAWLVFIFLRV